MQIYATPLLAVFKSTYCKRSTYPGGKEVKETMKKTRVAVYRRVPRDQKSYACLIGADERRINSESSMLYAGSYITPDRKSVYFWKSDFVSMCVMMVQKYAGGAFKRGTFYSVAGLPLDDEAFVFDFREAAEHIVKNTGHNGKKQAAHPAFNMPRGYTGMM